MSKYEITVNGKQFVVEIGDVSSSPANVVVDGESKTVQFKEVEAVSVGPSSVSSTATPAAAPEPAPKPEPTKVVTPAGEMEGLVVVAPMPGKILSITVNVGDSVSEGDTVCSLEAMKMEMPISCTTSGTVKAIHVQVGETVTHDAPLVTVG